MPIDFGRNVHCLLGLPFDAVDVSGALQRVRDAAVLRHPCFVSTPNLNFLVACQSDAAFRDSVMRSDLSLADGMPLIWMARLLGLPIRERVAGSSLFDALRRDAKRPLSVYFFGGPPGIADQACARLNAEARGLRCVGFTDPGFGSVEDMSSAVAIDRINASGADFLVVALGARKGQEWIERNRGRIVAPVISHLGAVVNFVAGTISRAPPWMQRTGLEWLWRVKEEPGLWRRYLADGIALLHLMMTRVLPHAWHTRRYRLATALALAPAAVEKTAEDAVAVLRLSGAWGEENLTPLRLAFAEVAADGGDLRLDLAGTVRVDSAFIGLLMLLHGHQSRIGRHLWVGGARPAVVRSFRWCCAEFVLDGGDHDRLRRN